MDKAFEIQKQARENVKVLQTYMTDLQNWEIEMKRKEAALNGQFEQDLPPVRSKIKKDKPVKVLNIKQPRITSSDYNSWEKFDVDKACEEIDMEDVGPVSLDSKHSESAKKEKLREEALYEKEKGNKFVKQEKWDEAISCYNRAIELVKDDAIYYANRGLCYLKKDSLHLAEGDCTEALRLDPTYVKALQRRATARERLGSLKAASNDLIEVLRLEPQNASARRQFEAIKARMGTKGAKSKSSPVTPTSETQIFASNTSQPKIVELNEPKHVVPTPLERWQNGEGDNITVIKPVKKPPHLRSKRALKTIPIKEIQIGNTTPDKPATRLNITEVDDLARGDTNNNESRITETKPKVQGQGDTKATSPVSEMSEVEKENLVPPMNSVQFMSEWKYLKGKGDARSRYLRLIEPSKIPSIFENALESDVLSELVRILHDDVARFQHVTRYLTAFSAVKRFSALAMFLSATDKLLLNNLLDHCKIVENCSDDVIADLRKKYEL